MTVSISKRAQAEASIAHKWYFEESPPAALRFIERFEELVEALNRFPRLGQRHGEHLRRLPMTPFPYLLYYRVRGDDVVIVRVMHAHRRTQPK